MAVFDPERGVVVVRIVYDGPPHAGKTTSVRSLARSLARSVETPLEAAGRTMFFDWMEYTGGLFDGHQIRCQIVSVPGQTHLAPRRRAILLDADAVVFVADTSHVAAAEESRDYVAALARLLRAEMAPPVGIVVQANKRDVATAVPTADLRRILGDAVSGVALTESSAHTGVGVRETFVFAVRLALDRVRELSTQGSLPRGRPAVDSAKDLIARLDAGVETSPVPDGQPPSAVQTKPAVQTRPPPVGRRDLAPRLPDASVPSGAIWPAVDGRLMLHEATAGDHRARRMHSGAWAAGIGSGWRIHSAHDASYPDLESGRKAVLAWARVHATLGEVLSPNRCIVVADAGDGSWRLWQIVRVAPSLREWLNELACADDCATLLEALITATRLLADATSREHHGLKMSLDTVGQGERGPRFVGLMPHVLSESAPSADASAESREERALDQIHTMAHQDLSRQQIAEMTALLLQGWQPAVRDEWARRLLSRLVGTSCASGMPLASGSSADTGLSAEVGQYP